MTVDREQTRQEFLRALNALRLELPSSVHDDFCVKSHALLAELEQAEKWANTMEHERDWERDVVNSDLLARAEAAEARLAKVPALVDDAIQLCDQHISDEQRKETQHRIIEWAKAWDAE